MTCRENANAISMNTEVSQDINYNGVQIQMHCRESVFNLIGTPSNCGASIVLHQAMCASIRVQSNSY